MSSNNRANIQPEEVRYNLQIRKRSECQAWLNDLGTILQFHLLMCTCRSWHWSLLKFKWCVSFGSLTWGYRLLCQRLWPQSKWCVNLGSLKWCVNLGSLKWCVSTLAVLPEDTGSCIEGDSLDLDGDGGADPGGCGWAGGRLLLDLADGGGP